MDCRRIEHAHGRARPNPSRVPVRQIVNNFMAIVRPFPRSPTSETNPSPTARPNPIGLRNEKCANGFPDLRARRRAHSNPGRGPHGGESPAISRPSGAPPARYVALRNEPGTGGTTEPERRAG